MQTFLFKSKIQFEKLILDKILIRFLRLEILMPVKLKIVYSIQHRQEPQFTQVQNYGKKSPMMKNVIFGVWGVCIVF